MRVVVLGAGYAGLTVARRLEDDLPEEAALLVVDERDHHVVQHELHRVIRRPELADVLRVPLDEVLDRADVRRARVTDVDTDAREVTVGDAGGSDGARRSDGSGGARGSDEARGSGEVSGSDGARGSGGPEGSESIRYDYAAVCLGAETAFYDLPGVEEHGIPLKRLAHADRIRSRFHAAEGGRTVVGGAGLSGVQVAGELAAVARDAGYDAEITLVERLDSVAPGFRPALQDAVREELRDVGVTVRTGTAVESADADAVRLASGEELPYDTFVWTGGIRGPAALGGERPATRSDLRVGDGTFVVGDAASVVDANGEPAPASAQAAVRQGRVAAGNIARLVDDDVSGGEGLGPRLDRYTFDSPGWIVSVGDRAVARVGPTVLRGEAARAAKATVGAGYLSSVGAIGRAASLVREEVGWPADGDRGGAGR
jgi:NADH dehydrogenase